MRADVLRLYKSVHTWTGIVAGMALFIAFYAGALTVFKAPIARWVAPPTAVAGGVDAVPLAEVPLLIERTLAVHPEAARSFRIELQARQDAPGRMRWTERPEGADDHDHAQDRHYAATLDAAGVPSVLTDTQSRVAEFIDVLHRVVGLPVDNDSNRWVMGVICALYAVALISGVILLLPTLVRDFFALRLGRNLKRMWLDAHNVVGIISLPFHVVMALTAAVFAFHDGLYAVQDRLIHEGQLARLWSRGAPPGPPPAPRDVRAMLPPQALVKRVQALSPTLEPLALEYAAVRTPRAVVRIWVRDTTTFQRSDAGGFAALDPYTGQVRSTDYLPGRQDGANATITSFFSLHFGSFGGTPVQWMYFLLGLAGAFLFYSGNLLWIESRRKADRGRGPAAIQTRSSRLMASATLGVCLGCVAGISLSLAAGKWLYGRVDDLQAWHMGVYYGVFGIALAWAFWRGPAQAAPELLTLAALCTAAIPLTSVLGVMWPATGLWAHAGAATVGVDLVAAAGALAWAWMARASGRRARGGPADSVWSLHGRVHEVKAAAAIPHGER
ncbi:putative iron-regulated membrane protein [Pseudacidovorax sp. 1753]|uniref:PepSY-associated TM helix domain-containing protein n=1 Tax=Pseudacidovorax sp. 1753 TaxID=3156419 RepID=UPI00339B4864